MSTTTVKKIGTTARDYSTIQAWEDACPANLTTSIAGGEIWQGQCYNDSEFSENVTISGQTVDATGYVHLTCATGQSAFDTSTNPLTYDQTKGVGLNKTSGTELITVSTDRTIVEKIQVKLVKSVYDKNAVIFTSGLSNAKIKDCLATGNGSIYVVRIREAKAINVVAICTAASTAGGFNGQHSASCINCTAVVPTSVTANGTGYNSAAGTLNVNNCASFGFTSATAGTVAGNYNGTEAASGMPGANSQHSLTYANQFTSTTADFTLKTGANLIAGGNTDATNAPNDIFGTARGATTAGDIGAHEFVAAASGGPFPMFTPPLRGGMRELSGGMQG